MTAVGQLAIETMDAELLASRRERRGLALSLLKPDTAEKVMRVKMAQNLHTALSGAEDVLKMIRKVDYTVRKKKMIH
jgi:hypothetical protein